MAAEIIIKVSGRDSRKLRNFRTALPGRLETGFAKAGALFEDDMRLKLSGPGRASRRGGGPRIGRSGRKFRTTSGTGSYPGVITGRLRNSIGYKVSHGSRGPSLEAGPNARGGGQIKYVPYLEKGTRFMQPYSFIGPSFQDKADAAIGLIHRHIIRPLDR